MGLSNEDIRSVAFTINPKDIGLVSCLERSTKVKSKILFTMPIRSEAVQRFPDCHISGK